MANVSDIQECIRIRQKKVDEGEREEMVSIIRTTKACETLKVKH